MMIDINYEGNYNEEEVAEKQLLAPEDAPRLEEKKMNRKYLRWRKTIWRKKRLTK